MFFSDETHLARERNKADAQYYKIQKEAESNKVSQREAESNKVSQREVDSNKVSQRVAESNKVS